MRYLHSEARHLEVLLDELGLQLVPPLVAEEDDGRWTSVNLVIVFNNALYNTRHHS